MTKNNISGKVSGLKLLRWKKERNKMVKNMENIY